MSAIVNISDYLGTVQLQQDDTTEDKFDAIRDEFSDQYVYKLLGAELGKLFLANLDVNGVPVTARFLAIFNAFANDDGCEGVQISAGLKYYIKQVIWFHYARVNNVLITTAGNTTKLGENSEPAITGNVLAHNFNKGIKTGKAIQWYICQNSDDYPEYKGQYLDYVVGL